jgi:hypothetical protein
VPISTAVSAYTLARHGQPQKGNGEYMTPEERFDRIEALLGLAQESEKQNEAAREMIVVGRTRLDSRQELREIQRKDHEEWVARSAATDEKSSQLRLVLA